MADSKSGSDMYYHGTDIEVQLGDHVRVKPGLLGWFKRPRNGVVCYIPGISPPHKYLEYDDVKQWAIRLEDGTIHVAGYFPESLPGGRLDKYLKFVSRGSGGEIRPDEIIDNTCVDAEGEEPE